MSPQTQPTPTPVNAQPQAGHAISFARGVSMPANANTEHQGASRLRGGGAAKDCCIGVLGVFVCCDICEGICDVVADIVCCPCEMIC
ncbi:hypothetical protein K443DRAFT_681992 [Laccaria amethystina LaAM-08-1]|uniref:Uncharacterized protein n=1 Tax=Laccaria amethystina LaAM-08-1 TaxID=1095629 RepID=A0A0C9X6A2_9AGAR|nr:hypothetical protein K443DRAFT_681992 [Laccaria amethystina LaAM-08-1]